MIISNNLNALRNKEGLTLQEVSDKTDVPLSTISRVFSGSTQDPKIMTLIPIAKGMGWSLDEICGLRKENDDAEDQPQPHTDSDSSASHGSSFYEHQSVFDRTQILDYGTWTHMMAEQLEADGHGPGSLEWESVFGSDPWNPLEPKKRISLNPMLVLAIVGASTGVACLILLLVLLSRL